jgi:hypothetical protein
MLSSTLYAFCSALSILVLSVSVLPAGIYLYDITWSHVGGTPSYLITMFEELYVQYKKMLKK